MKISEIYSAMGLKIKLNFEDTSVHFTKGILIRIEPTQDRHNFLVNQYGKGSKENKSVLCKASPQTADYLLDLFEGEHGDAYKCMFLIDGVNSDSLEIQTYTFQSVTEYKSAITIIVTDKLLENTTIEKLKKYFVWNQLGMPALFCLNYKNKKKQNANIRFIGGKSFLIAQNTARGIIADSIRYLKEKYDVPVDIFVAPEINFVKQSDMPFVNDVLSADIDKISNSASYFARWEAYDALSKKLLIAESEEFGQFRYSSYTFRTEINGVTYEFESEEELDDSLIGKELGASETEPTVEDLNDRRRKKQHAVGQVKKVTGNRITTFYETNDSSNEIPAKGILKLYTAGDMSIMARRLAARERMIKHRAPIKAIVELIEVGASRYELPNAWGNHKAVTEQLRRNFKQANDLNPEQIDALNLAINTPDIALIQGPPGTGKTTVIKAICERFREIFEAEEKQLQKANPEHTLRSPKILISSFQNEAVDNAISAPLPGDIPAYRKTAKRSSDSTKEQYQRSLEKWYNGLCDTITGMIEDNTAPEFIEKKRALDDEFLSYKNAGEPLDKALNLINHYLNYVEIAYPESLISEAKAIIMAVEAASSGDDYEDPIVKRIKEQRTTIDAFEDDGARNARKLAAYIRVNDDLEIDETLLDDIEKISEGGYSEDDFTNYVNAVNALEKRFCHDRIVIDIHDKDKINECILTLANVFSKHYMKTLSTTESKKSLILSEFLVRLEQDYENIVKKYSMTTAATCQTSLDLRGDSDKTFDLVIIDEAARANPLDLFIPMSMGKKLILVGDHKQLPHMLEPDVLKMLADDPKFQDIPEIEKSLFERLFDMFSNGQRRKAIALTHQFRMHPDICSFVSDAFYDGMLKTSKSITAEDKRSPKEINDGKALTFVNIPVSRGAETSGVSKSRWAEVELIGKDVRKILDIDPEASIGIITFYSAQVKLLKSHLDSFLNEEEKRNIEIGSVDAFQGKEFDYVLLSCVRANSPKNGEKPVVGFLEKPNRLCVAFSRSKRQLTVYGDADTLIQIPCFSKLYEICAIKGGGHYRDY